MPIKSLRLTGFRNLAFAELSPCFNGINIISGVNGSGKTSLLEAIYYLGLGRSFRTSTATRLIQQSQEKFCIFSQIVSSNRDIPVGAERQQNGESRLRVAENDASSITELASYLPLRLINSQTHYLLESGPVFRRKYLDWGVFYHFQAFLPLWRQYERVLKQRNALLRERKLPHEVRIWTDELVKYALELDKMRREYIDALTPAIISIVERLLGMTTIEIRYYSGWDESEDYATVLEAAFPDEIRAGHTLFGPHRADLDIYIDGLSAKHFLSRGQQKLLICAMILAQGVVLAKYSENQLIYLVDDLPAELDEQSRNKLISALVDQQTQVFVTAIEHEIMTAALSQQPGKPVKLFHVEHGKVVER